MLSNLHYIITWLGCEALRVYSSSFKVLPWNTIMNRDVLWLALFVGVVTPLNNMSLQLNGVGFYQTFKLLLTPCVVCSEYFLDGKVISSKRAVALGGVCAGVYVCSVSDLEFSLQGTIAASMWVPFATGYKVQWGRVQKRLGCDTLTLM